MTVTFILITLLVLIVGKWIFIVSLLPSQYFYSCYKNDNRMMLGILATPYVIINKWLRGGYELWSLYQFGKIPSCNIRKWFYKLSGVDMEKNVVIHIDIKMRAPWKLRIGKGTVVGDNCSLDARSGLSIGENVNISSNVSIWTLQHDYRALDFACPKPTEKKMDVTIGNRVWLGCNVIVLPGVNIGEGAVCCGGCVVTKDVPPYTVVAGIPAKKVGDRPQNLIYEFDGKTCRMF